MKLIKPGDEISYRMKTGKIGVKKVPKNFLKHHKITMRDNNGIMQANASDINKALSDYKIGKCFCILGVTNVDLYPRDEWNFVYGLAHTDRGTGVFSFYRH